MFFESISMKKGENIRRGAVVKITDWQGAPLKENRWIVQKVYTSPNVIFRGEKKPAKNVRLALIKKINKEKSASSSFSWTTADLQRVGFKNLPKIEEEKPISECVFWVNIDLTIERDGEDYFFLWNASCRNGWDEFGCSRTNINYKQVDSYYSRSRTVEACLNDWKRFADRNNISHYKVNRAYSTYEACLSMCKFQYCSKAYEVKFYSARNKYNRLWCWANYDGGPYGCQDAVLRGKGKKERIENMKNDGRWDDLQKLKKYFYEDFYLVNEFDDMAQMEAFHIDGMPEDLRAQIERSYD